MILTAFFNSWDRGWVTCQIGEMGIVDLLPLLHFLDSEREFSQIIEGLLAEEILLLGFFMG
jgi:hypothetical protein